VNLNSRKDIVFLILAGFFITNALMAEMIGGKLISFGIFVQSVGILPWPVVFLTTDLINEYYGRKGVIRLSFITVGLIAYAFILLLTTQEIPAIENSPVSDESFNQVFGMSRGIIIGSIIAFLVAQVIDALSFHRIKKITGSRHIWLRATGSTVISQLFDTFIVQFIAFVIPGYWSLPEFFENASMGYLFKLLVALGLIPFIYLFHYIIDRYLKVEGNGNT
jgi:queuosine precursor transporter